jgi:hypothetical protein
MGGQMARGVAAFYNDIFVEWFPSQTEAARQFNASRWNIRNVLEGTTKTAGGFSWRYMDKRPTLLSKK